MSIWPCSDLSWAPIWSKQSVNNVNLIMLRSILSINLRRAGFQLIHQDVNLLNSGPSWANQSVNPNRLSRLSATANLTFPNTWPSGHLKLIRVLIQNNPIDSTPQPYCHLALLEASPYCLPLTIWQFPNAWYSGRLIGISFQDNLINQKTNPLQSGPTEAQPD